MNDYYVEIVERDTEEVVKRMGPMGQRKADKVKGGAEINLNHAEFFVRVTGGPDE